MICMKARFPAVGVLLCVGLPIALASTGCGKSGPPRYEVSGRVTYNGQPLPAGVIRFEPDESKGNTGAIGQAEIRDGEYRTRHGTGAIGGPHVIYISGFDGVVNPEHSDESPFGTPLFPTYKTHLELPHQSSTHNFDVPVQPD